GDTVTYECLWAGKTRPLVVKDRSSNPLSGASELEIPIFDPGDEDVLLKSKHGVEPRVEVRNGTYIDQGIFYGHARQAFTPDGNNVLSIASNPPLANMLTLVSTPGRALNDRKPPDNRVIHLTPMKIE